MIMKEAFYNINNSTNKQGGEGALDNNNNLIAVNNGANYSGSLNRNINESQILTKSLTVDPINIKETFEFGRNSTESQMKADNKSINNRTLLSDIKQSNSNISIAKNIASGLTSSITNNLIEFAYQINPLRGFSNITDGITNDLRNIKTELNIDSISINAGPDAKYITIDKNNNRTEFTLEDLRNNPSLASTKVFSNGVMNTESEALGNALEQLGGYDKNGRITIAYDPTVAPEAKFSKDPWGNIGGFFVDMGEVLVNYAGAGILVTNVQKSNQEFLSILTDNAKETGQTIELAGHSAGGRRNYLTLLNSNPNQYLDSKGNSVLKVQFSGTPANAFDIYQAGQNSGASIHVNNKTGDMVGNILGANGSLLEAIWSGINTISLFEPEWKPNINYFEQKAAWDKLSSSEKEKINPPKKFVPLESDHSSYPCSAPWCNQNENLNLNFNQNSPLVPPININSNSGSR